MLVLTFSVGIIYKGPWSKLLLYKENFFIINDPGIV